MMSALAQRSLQYEELSGRQKAAIVCMVIGAERAAKVQEQLSPEEIELLNYEIARTSKVDPNVVEAVLLEWMELIQAANTLAHGGIELARQILERVYGQQKAAAMIKRIQTQLQDKAGLHRLRNADPTQLSAMLRGEHPQTVALILAHLQPHHAKEVLKELEPSFGGQVLLRMARMEKVAPEMLNLIERAMLIEDISSTEGMSASGGTQAVATILNGIPSSLEKEFLDVVQAHDPQLCLEIRNLMFVFEDTITLEVQSIQKVLKEVDTKDLALALKGASEELREKILAAMSQRARDALMEQMEMSGRTRKRDVETAQHNIVSVIRRLEEAGELELDAGDEEYV